MPRQSYPIAKPQAWGQTGDRQRPGALWILHRRLGRPPSWPTAAAAPGQGMPARRKTSTSGWGAVSTNTMDGRRRQARCGLHRLWVGPHPERRITRSSSIPAHGAGHGHWNSYRMTEARPASEKCPGPCGKQKWTRGRDLRTGREPDRQSAEGGGHCVRLRQTPGPCSPSLSLLNLWLTACAQRICSCENCIVRKDSCFDFILRREPGKLWQSCKRGFQKTTSHVRCLGKRVMWNFHITGTACFILFFFSVIIMIFMCKQNNALSHCLTMLLLSALEQPQWVS